jgi:AhpD family alkylhydroperoxidase
MSYKFKLLSPETATGKAQELLQAVKKSLGKVPNILGAMAQSTTALGYYLEGSQALKQGRLTPKEREQIALAVAGANDCAYCSAAHGFVGKALGLSLDELRQNRAGRAADARTDLLLRLATAVIATKGHLSPTLREELEAQGIDAEIQAEVVAHVAHNVFTNFFNHVAATEVDFPSLG